MPGAGGNQGVVAALFVGYAREGPFILDISPSGSRHFSDRPHEAIGSGDIFALHAMRSVAHYDVANLPLECAQALAYRTVDNAIRTAAFGLGGRVQLLVVTPTKKAACLTPRRR